MELKENFFEKQNSLIGNKEELNFFYEIFKKEIKNIVRFEDPFRQTFKNANQELWSKYEKIEKSSTGTPVADFLKDIGITEQKKEGNKTNSDYCFVSSDELSKEAVIFFDLFNKNQMSIEFSVSLFDGDVIKTLLLFTNGLIEKKHIKKSSLQDFEEVFKIKAIDSLMRSINDPNYDTKKMVEDFSDCQGERKIEWIDQETSKMAKKSKKNIEKEMTEGCIEVYDYKNNTGTFYGPDDYPDDKKACPYTYFSFFVEDKKERELRKKFAEELGIEYYDCRDHIDCINDNNYNNNSIKFDECKEKFSTFVKAIKNVEEGKEESVENLKKLINDNNCKKDDELVAGLKGLFKKQKTSEDSLKKKIERILGENEEQKKEFKNELAGQKSCILNLQKENEELQNRISKSNLKIKESEEKNIKVFNEVKDKNKDLYNKLRAKIEEVKNLEAELKKQKSNVIRHKERNEKLQKENEKLQVETNEQKKSILKLQDENNNSIIKLKESEKEHERFKKDLEGNNKLVIDLSDKLNKKEAEIKKLEDMIGNFKKKMKDHFAQNMKLKQQDEEIKSLKAELNRKDSNILELKENNKKLQDENNNSIIKLKESEEEYKKLEKDLADNNMILGNAIEEQGKRDLSVSKLEEENKKLQNRINESSLRLKDNEKKMEELNKIKKSYEAVQKELKVKDEKIKNLKSKFAEKESSFSKISANNLSIFQENIQIKKELKSLKDENEKLNKTSLKMKKENDKLKKEIESNEIDLQRQYENSIYLNEQKQILEQANATLSERILNYEELINGDFVNEQKEEGKKKK